jgi:predicted DNA-binding protein YlxM (UPF0122 family)
MSVKNTSLNSNNIITAYLSGISIKKLAEINNVSRQVIYRILRENSIVPRGRSESMFVRMAHTTPEYRQKLSQKAHDAVRGMKRSHEELCKRAIVKQLNLQVAGRGERHIIEELKNRGIESVHQFAIDKFNIDVAIPYVAVELCISSSINPFCLRHNAEKIEYLCKAGWVVIFIMIKKPSQYTSSHTDYIISKIEELSRDKTISGSYWVIGRDCKLHSTGCFNS